MFRVKLSENTERPPKPAARYLWAAALAALLAIALFLVWPAFLAPAPARPTAGADLYSEAYLRHLETTKPVNPARFTGDPYAFYAAHPDQLGPTSPGAVCAIKYLAPDRRAYRIADYRTATAAIADGAHITHAGRCGTCSDLKDLAVYLRRPDLTTPVRRCAMLGAVKPLAMRCLQNLGFTPACAETWYANARNTGRRCYAVCIRSWASGEPSNRPDGRLNTCLACDEAASGPVFKQVAGRTRRNSGIVTSIGRGAGEVFAVTHDY